MATVANLERLEALIDSLSTLSGKRRGELIEADSWNSLVGALTEVARATLAERAADDVPPHKHTDQVDLGWLDAKLRSIVLDGGFSEPAAQARLDLMTRRIDKLGAALDALSDRIDRMQTGLSQVETRDVERESNLTSVSRRLDTVFNARDDVADLRGSLRLIEGQVRTAADLSARLESPDGEQIDFEGLAARIGELEALRSTLTLPDGATFSAQAYRRDLEQLRAELVTEEELSEQLEDVRGSIGSDLEGAVLEAARAAARTTADEAIGGLSDRLRQEQDARFGALEESLPARIEEATGDLSEQVLTQARSEREAALDERFGAFAAERDARLDERVAEVESGLLETLSQRTAELEESLTARIDADVQRGLAEFGQRLSAAEENLGGLGGRIDGLTETLSANAARIETVRRDLQQSTSALGAQLTERIARLESDFDGRLLASRERLAADLRAEMNADLTALRRDLRTDLSGVARTAARTEVDLASARIRGEAAEIAAAEVEGQLSGIRDSAAASGTLTRSQIAGLVAEEVRRANANQSERIRSELESFEPQIERIVDRRISNR